MPTKSSQIRYAAAGLATLALTFVPALAASAHVHVDPESTVAGSRTALIFTVPSESDTAGTTSLTVTLPADHPFLRASARSTPGWTVKLAQATLPKPVTIEGTTITEAVHTVTWTAKPGSEIPPEQYQNFELTVSPLPASGDVVFAAQQTYSDGSVVNWNEPTPAGGAEPEHPAPSFSVTPAGEETSAAETTEEEPAAASSSDDGLARWLGATGLLAGLAALGLAIAHRSPRRIRPDQRNGVVTLDPTDATDASEPSNTSTTSDTSKPSRSSTTSTSSPVSGGR